MGEHRDANNTGEGNKRVTIAEAATLLGVHPNTVRNRVKGGMYRAEKVLTERGPTWMIDRDSLTTNTPTSASQQLVSRVPPEALQVLAREIVREAGPREEEDWIEGEKLIYDAAKTQALITAALLGAAAAARFLPNPEYIFLLILAIVFGVASSGLALAHMHLIANTVRWAQLSSDRITRRLADLLSMWIFVAATALLAIFVGLNV
jgi:hypothetical protein